MFNRQQCLANCHVLDELDKTAGFRPAHACGGLVQQYHACTTCNGDADLQCALLCVSQVHTKNVAFFVELDHFHQLFGALIGIVKIGEKFEKSVLVAKAPQHTATQVFKHAEFGKNIGDLKAARQTKSVDLIRLFAIDALAIEQYVSAGGLKAPADQIKKGGFSSPVWSDDGHTLTRFDRQIDAANNFCFAKAFAQVFQFQRAGRVLAGWVAGAHSASLRLVSFSMYS